MKYSEVDAGVIGVPEHIMIFNDEIPGDGVALVKDVFVDALVVVHRHR